MKFLLLFLAALFTDECSSASLMESSGPYKIDTVFIETYSLGKIFKVFSYT